MISVVHLFPQQIYCHCVAEATLDESVFSLIIQACSPFKVHNALFSTFHEYQSTFFRVKYINSFFIHLRMKIITYKVVQI